jgi:hypothetical protein
MPQGPIPTQMNAKQPSGVTKPVNADADGNLIVSGIGGTDNALFIVAPGKNLKMAAGVVGVVTVLAAGSGVGGVYDCTGTAAAVTATQIAVIPETVGPLTLQFPFVQGLTIVPGTGQEVSVSYQ